MARATTPVIGALSVFYTLLSVSLFVPVVAGLYLRRIGTPETFAAIGCGGTAMLVTQLGTAWGGLGPRSPVVVGLLAAALGCAAAALFPRGRHRASAA